MVNVMCNNQNTVILTASGRIQEFVDLLARCNRAFYDRDWVALRALYVPDVEMPYFDNHADGDSTNLATHLKKVETFFERGDIVPLLVKDVRDFVHGDAACVVATVRYSTARCGPLLDGIGTWSSGSVLLGASCERMEDTPYPFLAGSKRNKHITRRSSRRR